MNRRKLLTSLAALPLLTALPRPARAGNLVGDSFHVYPSRVQTFKPYDEGTPLACDTVEFDLTGGWYRNALLPNGNPGYCWVSPTHCLVHFFGQVLWWQPIEGSGLALKIMVNSLGSAAGDEGGEVVGQNDIAHQFAGYSLVNKSSEVSRTIEMFTNQVAWLVPVQASARPQSLAPAFNRDNTCCFFEGTILKMLL
jgi:hypothetical protein